MMNLYNVIEKIHSAFNVRSVLTQKEIDALTQYAHIYAGEAPWITQNTLSLSIGRDIAQELARLTVLELDAEFGAEDDIMQKFLRGIQPIVSRACALGGVIFCPYVDKNGKISINAIAASNFVPIEFSIDGELTAVAIATKYFANNTWYTLLEYRHFENKTETVEFRAFSSHEANVIGNEVPLNEAVPELRLPERYTIPNLEAPLFVYCKMPFAPISWETKIGASCYGDAIPLLKDADEQYTRLIWEYEAGEFAVFADENAIERKRNHSLLFSSISKHKQRIYSSKFCNDIGIDGLFKEWNPALRSAEYYEGLNNILRKIEFKCGLSYGTLSNVNEARIKTATEIIMSRQRSYSTISSIQHSLEIALTQLSGSVCAMLKTPQQAPVFNWDDSLIVDTQQEKEMFLQELSAGVVAPWEYRAKFYGETEAQARKMINEINTELQLEEEEEEDQDDEKEEKKNNEQQGAKKGR